MDLRQVNESIVELKLMMVEHSKDLKEHMRRTEILESHVTVLNGELVKLKVLFMVAGWIGAALGVIGGPILQWWLAR